MTLLRLTPTPDIARLRRVLKQLDEHPELWDQTIWMKKTACGTAGCIAGWTCLLEGDAPALLWSEVDWEFLEEGQATARVLPGGNDGDLVYIEERAAELLGLTVEERQGLFLAGNDRSDIEYWALLIAERAGVELWPAAV